MSDNLKNNKTIKRLDYCFSVFFTASLLIFSSCSKQDEASSSNAAAVSTSTASTGTSTTRSALPQNMVVAGQLSIAANDKSVSAPPASVSLKDRPVELVDQGGAVVASGKAAPSGAFKLAINTSTLQLALKLAEETNQASTSSTTVGSNEPAATTSQTAATSTISPTLLTVRSLSLTDETDKKAIGVKRQIVLDPNSVAINTTGENELTVGQFSMKKVGAITGVITLETGEDATGTDVYIPGTTYIAKTDADGRFLIGFLPQGSFTLRADRDGYTSLEWADVKVGNADTTSIGDIQMKIGNGPKIKSFILSDESAIALSANIKVSFETSGSTKFRISQLSDFRDTVYRPLDYNNPIQELELELSGSDGTKTIYLEVADSDGLTAKSSLDVLLDTHVPLAPAFYVSSAQAKKGYSNSLTPTLRVDSCDDIVKLRVTENTNETPQVSDFNINCSEAKNGVTVNLSQGTGAKNLYLWALDAANQKSLTSSQSQIIVDTAPPVLTIAPAINSGTDTILSKETTELTLNSSEPADIYYTFNLATPTAASALLESASGNGRLVLIADATLKAISIDYAGNASPVMQRNIVIDRDGPILGSISATTTNGVVNSLSIPLTLSAQGASRMRLAESLSTLQTANWITYATSYTYTLQSTTDGNKTVYVMFADAAGNLVGSSGDIFATFQLDRTPPPNDKITLLQPESPTGAFNTPLVWNQTFDSITGLRYVIEVHGNASYTDLQRTMTSVENAINIDPPLTVSGTYYWRVKAEDSVGNATDWVESGSAKSFTVGILAQSYQAKKEIKGVPKEQRYFGRNMLALGDKNSDGITEVALSIFQATFTDSDSTCTDCGLVRIYDLEHKTTIKDIHASQPSSSFYGHKMALCNVTGDAEKELIISAPGKSQTAGGVTYNNVGAVYVYDVANNYQLITTIEPTLPAGNPIAGYYNCSQWGVYPCPEYGWKLWPYSVVDWINSNDSKLFGWSISCLENGNPGITNTDGLDALFIGEPFYHDGSYKRGKVHQYEKISGSFTSTKEILGPTDQFEPAFGMSVLAMNHFKYTGCTDGSTIAVGRPKSYVNSGEKGAVDLYQYSAGSWSKCATINAANDDPDWCRYGQGLFNLGDIDKDGTVEELAISGSCYSGGMVRIYGGSSGTLLKTYRDTSSDSGFLGYDVQTAGDFNTDGQSELAITVPSAKVNGIWGAGKVLILDWATMDTTNGTTGTVIRTISGIPSGDRKLGVSFLPVRSSSSNIHSTTNSTYITAPGLSVSGEWSVGSIGEYALIKMAPGLPTKVEGTVSNESLGQAIVPVTDMNADGTADLLLTRPGALCDSGPTGNVVIYSVLDGMFGAKICDVYDGWSRPYLGTAAFLLPTTSTLIFTKNGTGYALYLNSFSQKPLVNNSTHYPDNPPWSDYVFYTPWGQETIFSEPYPNSTNWYDEFLLGKPKESDNGTNNGAVKLIKSTGNLTENICRYRGASNNIGFGRGIAFIDDVNGDGVRDILIGSPGETAGSSTGKIYLINGDLTNYCNSDAVFTIDSTHALVLASIDADSAAINSALGRTANGGFGSFIAALPNYSAAAGSKGFLFTANNNMQAGTSSVTPQYFVIRINSDYSFTVMSQETGVSGGMLGGYAKVIDDVNGDGKKEIAVSYPGGTGRLGQTGHIEILSGAGMMTTDSSDDLIQRLFSPATAASNFGYSFQYVDMTGDGLKDFVVGANKYNGTFQNAGAIFTYPMKPIQSQGQ